MSIYAISWVLKHSTAEKVDRLVLIALADYANDDGGGAWPAVANIGVKARVSNRSVQYSLRRLEDGGHIEKSGVTPKGTNVYRILMGEGGAPIAPPAKNEPAGAQKTPLGAQGAAPEPSLDTSGVEPSTSGENAEEKILAFWLSLDPGKKPAEYKLTKKRAKAIKGRLDDSSRQEIREALEGQWHDPWCQQTGKLDLEYALRDRDHLEDFRDRRRKQLAAGNGSSNGSAPSAHPEYNTTKRNPVVEAIALLNAGPPLQAGAVARALDLPMDQTVTMLEEMVEIGDCVRLDEIPGLEGAGAGTGYGILPAGGGSDGSGH